MLTLFRTQVLQKTPAGPILLPPIPNAWKYFVPAMLLIGAVIVFYPCHITKTFSGIIQLSPQPAIIYAPIGGNIEFLVQKKMQIKKAEQICTITPRYNTQEAQKLKNTAWYATQNAQIVRADLEIIPNRKAAEVKKIQESIELQKQKITIIEQREKVALWKKNAKNHLLLNNTISQAEFNIAQEEWLVLQEKLVDAQSFLNQLHADLKATEWNYEEKLRNYQKQFYETKQAQVRASLEYARMINPMVVVAPAEGEVDFLIDKSSVEVGEALSMISPNHAKKYTIIQSANVENIKVGQNARLYIEHAVVDARVEQIDAVPGGKWHIYVSVPQSYLLNTEAKVHIVTKDLPFWQYIQQVNA